MRKYKKANYTPQKADLIERAAIAEKRVRELRINITKSEERVMKLLDELRYKYIFQYAMFDEWYFLIADFYLPKLRLMIEVDGDTHLGKYAKMKEAKRKKWLQSQGIDVLRIRNKATLKMTARELEIRIHRVQARRKQNAS